MISICCNFYCIMNIAHIFNIKRNNGSFPLLYWHHVLFKVFWVTFIAIIMGYYYALYTYDVHAIRNSFAVRKLILLNFFINIFSSEDRRAASQLSAGWQFSLQRDWERRNNFALMNRWSAKFFMRAFLVDRWTALQSFNLGSSLKLLLAQSWFIILYIIASW
jgi:hypothetical protein